ncbi:MAG TPA: DedA family protein [Actinomycetota bacterium]
MEQFVTDLVRDHGLLALFVLMLLDNIGVPFPSEIPLLLAGYFVWLGDMNFVSASVVSATGSLAGALILYILGRSVGRAILVRWGGYIRVGEQDIYRAERWFHRRGEPSVFFLRVVPLARTLISIPAGMLEMRPLRFASYTVAGSLLWAFIVIGAGWALGPSYKNALDRFGLASIVAASIIGMVAVIWIVRRIMSRRPPAEERSPES